MPISPTTLLVAVGVGLRYDAAPYFRIFNPITQGPKFDPKGAYARRFVPELNALDTKQLFSPWDAGPLTLSAADIRLGETYPAPIVDHAAARARALAAFASIKGAPDDAKTPEQIVEKEAQAA